MRDCSAREQHCALGPLPPRTPGRADPQVPTLPPRGAVRYGRIPLLYFYMDDRPEDPAFGLLDIEVSVAAPVDGRSAVEVYCVGDGYQGGQGSARGEPLQIRLCAAGHAVAALGWVYPDVLSGHADAMTFAAEVPMSAADFEALDGLLVPPARAGVRVDE